MDGVALLQEAWAAGLTLLQRPDGRLVVRGPRQASELARRLLKHKEEVLHALAEWQGFLGVKTQNPPPSAEKERFSPPASGGEAREALRVWEAALRHVAWQWEKVASDCREMGREPPWVPEDLDLRLQSAVAEAIRAGDAEETRRKAAAWRKEWESALRPTSDETPVPRPNQGGGVEHPLSGELRERLEARGRNLEGTALFDLVGNENFAAAERKVYRAEILSRADVIIDEAEGSRPPPNASVHEMFDAARRRIGWRDVEERSITMWLRQHAPEVAARWPEAPVTAAWLDWRQHVGPEDIVALDKAFEATRERRAEEPGALRRKLKVRRRKPKREETSS